MVRVYVITSSGKVVGIATNKKKAIEAVEKLVHDGPTVLKEYGRDEGYIIEQELGTKAEYKRFTAY